MTNQVRVAAILVLCLAGFSVLVWLPQAKAVVIAALEWIDSIGVWGHLTAAKSLVEVTAGKSRATTAEQVLFEVGLVATLLVVTLNQYTLTSGDGAATASRRSASTA
jgi:hypothetical protein